MRVALMGIQASGKGTFGHRLADDLRVPKIVVGDLLRDRAGVDDGLGRRVAASLARGEFADEALVVQSLAERIAEAPAGFVLDGFPRFGRQVETLDAMLARLGVELEAPVYLHLSEDEARRRLADRLICRTCNRATSRLVATEDAPCPFPGCSGRLTYRPDDRDPAAVDKRLIEFRVQTLPVIHEYRATGRLIEIDVSRPEEEAYQALREAIVAIAPPRVD